MARTVSEKRWHIEKAYISKANIKTETKHIVTVRPANIITIFCVCTSNKKAQINTALEVMLFNQLFAFCRGKQET